MKNGVDGSLSAKPVPSAGRINNKDVMNFTLRPPQIAIMNEFGMRNVAPESPATAGSVYSSAWYAGPASGLPSGPVKL